MNFSYDELRELAKVFAQVLRESNYSSDIIPSTPQPSNKVSNIFDVFDKQERALFETSYSELKQQLDQLHKDAFKQNIEFGKNRTKVLREIAKLSMELAVETDEKEKKLKEKQVLEYREIQKQLETEHKKDRANQQAAQKQLAEERKLLFFETEAAIQKQREEFFKQNYDNFTENERKQYAERLYNYSRAREAEERIDLEKALRRKETLEAEYAETRNSRQDDADFVEELDRKHFEDINKIDEEIIAKRAALEETLRNKSKKEAFIEHQSRLSYIDKEYQKSTKLSDQLFKKQKDRTAADTRKAANDYSIAQKTLAAAEEVANNVDPSDKAAAEEAATALAGAQAGAAAARRALMIASLKQAAANAVSYLYDAATKSIDAAIDIAGKYTANINTRLQGSGKSYWGITRLMEANLALSPYASQSKMIENINKLADEGVAYNIEQRAFLMTISDKIASTFNAANGTLLRLIRLQQADTTAIRAGLVATLNQFLNRMFEDSSYMSQSYEKVSEILIEANSLMSREQSAEFEYITQKWLGSLTSVGLSESAVSTIAQALSYLATGDVSSLASNTPLQTLLAMSSSKAGIDYAEMLNKGLDASSTNVLLKSMVEYLKEIAVATKESHVVRSAYSNLFNLSVSDLAAISNLTTEDIQNIYKNTLSYSGAEAAYNKQVATIFTRMDAASMMQNIYENVLYNIGQNIAANPAFNAIWKLNTAIEQATGGINLPFVNVMGFGLDLNTNLNDLIKLGLVGIGTLGLIPQVVSSLAIQTVSGGRGAWFASEYTSRGGGVTTNGGVSSSESASGYVGNTDTEDIYGSTVTAANKSAREQSKVTGAQEDLEEAKTAADIYEKLFTDKREAVLVKIEGLDVDSLMDREWNVIVRNPDVDEALSKLARMPWD